MFTFLWNRCSSSPEYANGKFCDLPTRGQYQVKKGDLLVAKNNSSRGTVVLIPDEYDGIICTSGFLVIRPESAEQGMLLWYALRSEHARSQNYYLAQTASQPELKLNVWKNEFIVPMPQEELRIKALETVNEFMQHISALGKAREIRLP